MKLEREALKKLIRESLQELQTDALAETDIEEGFGDSSPSPISKNRLPRRPADDQSQKSPAPASTVKSNTAPPPDDADPSKVTHTAREGGVHGKAANNLLKGIQMGQIAAVQRAYTSIKDAGKTMDAPQKALILTTLAKGLLSVADEELSRVASAMVTKKTSVKAME